MVPTTVASPRTRGSKVTSKALSPDELQKLDAYWRASNYLSVGQIYLLDNPLLKEPLKREHIKPRLLGHWGTSPGLRRTSMVFDLIWRRSSRNSSGERLPNPPVPWDIEPDPALAGTKLIAEASDAVGHSFRVESHSVAMLFAEGGAE